MKTAEKILLSGLLPLALAACGSESTVSYSQDIKPILDQHCIECHQPGGAGLLASGFDMTSYEGLMRGTNFGPMVIAGDPEGSNLLVLAEGRADPSISMPHGPRDPVAKTDIQTIRTWIEQGANNN
jgi:mono/diheme cytochrome c family protein